MISSWKTVRRKIAQWVFFQQLSFPAQRNKKLVSSLDEQISDAKDGYQVPCKIPFTRKKHLLRSRLSPRLSCNTEASKSSELLFVDCNLIQNKANEHQRLIINLEHIKQYMSNYDVGKIIKSAQN